MAPTRSAGGTKNRPAISENDIKVIQPPSSRADSEAISSVDDSTRQNTVELQLDTELPPNFKL